MSLFQYLLIASGGAIGALARYTIGAWLTNRFPMTNFPIGTFVINISGSFLVGLVLQLLAERVLHSPNWRPFFTIGFVGAYTTFSTFEYETAQLGSSLQAFFNLTGSVVLGYLAVWSGMRLAVLIGTGLQR